MYRRALTDLLSTLNWISHLKVPNNWLPLVLNNVAIYPLTPWCGRKVCFSTCITLAPYLQVVGKSRTARKQV